MASRSRRRHHGRRPSTPLKPRTEVLLGVTMVAVLVLVVYFGMRA